MVAGGPRDTILKSIQLIAGRSGQVYNLRKSRTDDFWQDRYHATAIQTNELLNPIKERLGNRAKGRKIYESDDE